MMILEKMMANSGCIAPLMMAQMVPTKMYGHSLRLRYSNLGNDMGATSSSYRETFTKLDSGVSFSM